MNLMKIKILFLSLITIGLFGCNAENEVLIEEGLSEVLLLKVNYATHKFEGGKVFTFSKKSNSFTIAYEYEEPADFGGVKLFYKELNEPLFEGTIHWMGLGEMTFPKELDPPDSFDCVITNDVPYVEGFEVVFNPDNRVMDYEQAWPALHCLVKMREFLSANPKQIVKLFLYTPSVGVGNPDDWSWIFFLKK